MNVKIVASAYRSNLFIGKNGILAVELWGARHKNYVSIVKNEGITIKNAYFHNVHEIAQKVCFPKRNT